ncbi:MAG: hypothetical protein M1833_003400 [Piccolia ochrophora]|nr:MAG: hypothetical protein M1833_003400 [Piccolia ochrophora]
MSAVGTDSSPNILNEWLEDDALQSRSKQEVGVQEDAGFVQTLYRSCLRVFGEIWDQLVRSPFVLKRRERRMFKESLGRFVLWGADFQDGDLDKALDASDRMRDVVLELLLGVGENLARKVVPLLPASCKSRGFEQQIKDLSLLMEKAHLVASYHRDDSESDEGGESDESDEEASGTEDVTSDDRRHLRISELATCTSCLLDLSISLSRCLTWVHTRDDDIQAPTKLDFTVSDPARPYVLKIYDKFPSADTKLIERFGEANWQRHMRIRSWIEHGSEE